MKKLLFTVSIGLIVIACGNSKEIDQESSESASKAAVSPSEAPAPHAEAFPNGVVGESVGDTKPITTSTTQTKPMTIEWLDFETAIERNQDNPKSIFIDVYTDWCGWCKRMDATTFVDQKVVAFMNEHFYAVKMDAEMREAIAYNGKLYEYKQYSAKAGYNTLSVSLLDSKMSFPSFVILDKKEVKKGKIMGYSAAPAFLLELKKYAK